MLTSIIHQKLHPHLQQKDNVGHADMLTQKQEDNMREKQNQKWKLKAMYPFKCVTVFNPVTPYHINILEKI